MFWEKNATSYDKSPCQVPQQFKLLLKLQIKKPSERLRGEEKWGKEFGSLSARISLVPVMNPRVGWNVGDVSTLLLFLMNQGAILKSFSVSQELFPCLRRGIFFFFSVRFERLCLFQPAPAVQWNVFKMSLALCGLAGSRVGWSWLRTFWSAFAKVLQQEVEADGFTGVVSVFIFRDIWGEKAFSFSPEEAQVLTRHSDQLVCE